VNTWNVVNDLAPRICLGRVFIYAILTPVQISWKSYFKHSSCLALSHRLKSECVRVGKDQSGQIEPGTRATLQSIRWRICYTFTQACRSMNLYDYVTVVVGKSYFLSFRRNTKAPAVYYLNAFGCWAVFQDHIVCKYRLQMG
jgi:hypothetical protein